MRQFHKTKPFYGQLANNPAHNFALRHTSRIFESNSTFTWIPKNACSTMRFSIAKANGCIESLEDVNWIHANNHSFNATTETAACSGYTFVILRCPYTRLYSAFMDKMVNFDIQAWAFRDACNRSFNVHDLTFKRFIHEIGAKPVQSLDIHWRRQTDFLLFANYDDYFCLENFAKATKIIGKKARVTITDTRQKLGHDVARDAVISGDPAPYNKSALELLLQKRNGVIPAPKDMFDAEMVGIVKTLYADDLDLYTEKFKASNLMQKFA